MQYTLSRAGRWRWSNMDWIREDDTFSAEIKGAICTSLIAGGNQGKLHTMKHEVPDRFMGCRLSAPFRAPRSRLHSPDLSHTTAHSRFTCKGTI